MPASFPLTPFHMFPGMFAGLSCGYHSFPYPSPAVHTLPSSSALAHNVVTEDGFHKMIQVHRKRRLANEVNLHCIGIITVLKQLQQ